MSHIPANTRRLSCQSHQNTLQSASVNFTTRWLGKTRVPRGEKGGKDSAYMELNSSPAKISTFKKKQNYIAPIQKILSAKHDRCGRVKALSLVLRCLSGLRTSTGGLFSHTRF